jgi:hypothetical protein
LSSDILKLGAYPIFERILRFDLSLGVILDIKEAVARLHSPWQGDGASGSEVFPPAVPSVNSLESLYKIQQRRNETVSRKNPKNPMLEGFSNFRDAFIGSAPRSQLYPSEFS